MEEDIKSFILKNYGVEVTDNTLISEIAEDSLSRIELLFEIESKLKHSIPQEKVLDIETFGDLMRALEP